MDKITFASISSGMDIETILLVDSIREFGGAYADSKILLFLLQPKERLPSSRIEYFEERNVELLPVTLDPEVAKFSFTLSVHSASEAEKLLEGKSEFLVWLAPNGMIIKEPKDFLLHKSKNFGYKPVHHILIGSKFDEPLDDFWDLIYKKCGVNEETVFPMKTHIDGNILRPYINSGFLIVRPEKGFLRKYWENYSKLYNDQDFEIFYMKSQYYDTFIHQAVLSATMLTHFKKEEIVELPFNYNYPIHLYPESIEECKPENISNLITARFYLEKLQDPDWFSKIPIREPLKKWLLERIKS